MLEARRGVDRDVVAVVIADRTPEGMKPVEMLGAMDSRLLQDAQEWAREGGPGYLVVKAERSSAAAWKAPTLAALLRTALPAALGEAIDAQKPVLLSTPLNDGLLQVIAPALTALTNGELPQTGQFPLAANYGGQEIDVERVQVPDQQAFGEVLLVRAYGHEAGDRLLRSQSPKWHRQVRVQGFRQHDGSLVYLSTLAGGETVGAHLAPSAWKLLSDQEYAEQKDQVMGVGATRH